MKKELVKELLMRATSQYVDRLLDGEPFSNEHLSLIDQALVEGSLKLVNGTIVLPDGRKWSLVTVNREYVAHLGVYLKLQGEYPQAEIKLEDQFMDLVVYGPDFTIAVEVKKSIHDSERLERGLKVISQAPDISANDRGNDPLRKAKAILNIKPHEFWLASPEQTKKFIVRYTGEGFVLVENSFRQNAA
jgi:hypothetical protein